jgi:hypothetical protein
LGGLALFVALGGTAAAATGSLVNIADPSNSADVAHVDSSGRLQVGDSAGPLSVKASGGSVGISGAVNPSPERVLASGACNDNSGNPVVITVPNTATLRIRSISVSQTYLNSGSERLSIFPPGSAVTGTPLMNLYAGDLAGGGQSVNLPNTMDFGAGLASSTSGNWTFRCGSVTNDIVGVTEGIWMVLGSN